MSPLFQCFWHFESEHAQCDSLRKIVKRIVIECKWCKFQVNFEWNSSCSLFSFQLTTDKCKSLLVQAICNILMKCKDDRYRIVYILDQCRTADALSPLPFASSPAENATTADTLIAAESSIDTGAAGHSEAELEWSPDEFHERLSCRNFENIDDVEKYYSENYHVLSGNYGVLLFMYTVLMTKVSGVLRSEYFMFACVECGFRSSFYRIWRILSRNCWTHRSHWFTTHTAMVHKVS